MTQEAIDLINAFEDLNPLDKQTVAAEILRRSAGSDHVSDDAFQELAAELFAGYDAEEAARADR